MQEENSEPSAKKDRLEEIKQEVAKFSQQVNEYLKGRKEIFSGVPTQNDLAILRHARAIVDDQLRNPPDNESRRKLMHVKEKLDERIGSVQATLEAISEGPSLYSSKGKLSLREKATIVGITAAGASLLALGIYLAYRRSSTHILQDEY